MHVKGLKGGMSMDTDGSRIILPVWYQFDKLEERLLNRLKMLLF